MDKGGYTPMDIVSGLPSKSSRELVRLLLEASFNLRERNCCGEDYLILYNQNVTQGGQLHDEM
jgi:hypothetical protein